MTDDLMSVDLFHGNCSVKVGREDLEEYELGVISFATPISVTTTQVRWCFNVNG